MNRGAKDWFYLIGTMAAIGVLSWFCAGCELVRHTIATETRVADAVEKISRQTTVTAQAWTPPYWFWGLIGVLIIAAILQEIRGRKIQRMLVNQQQTERSSK